MLLKTLGHYELHLSESISVLGFAQKACYELMIIPYNMNLWSDERNTIIIVSVLSSQPQNKTKPCTVGPKCVPWHMKQHQRKLRWEGDRIYIYIGWKWHRIIKKLFYSFIDNLYVSALQKDVSSMNAKPPVCEGGGAIMHGLKPAISSRRQSHFINLWYHA